MATAIDLRRTGGTPSAGTHVFKVIRFSEESGPKGPYGRWIVQVQDGPDAGKEMLLQIGYAPNVRFKMDEFLDAIKAPLTGTWTGDKAVGKVFRGTVVIQPDRDNPTIKRAGFSNMTTYEGQLDFTIPDRPIPSIDGDEEDEVADDVPFDPQYANPDEIESDEEDVF